MTAVVLCPGPSLSQLAEVPKCDLSIGVNRAAIAFRCDVWAAADYPTIKNVQEKVIGNPKLLTKRQTWEDIKHRVTLPLAGIAEDCGAFLSPDEVVWLAKTFSCAVVFAAALGANRIDYYGCDWKGEEDFDGKKAGEDRSDTRWRDERAMFGALTEILLRRGVEVRRHGPT